MRLEHAVRYRWHKSSKPIYLDPLFLRDACSCGQCVDPSTRQKRFETSDLPLEPRVQSQRVLPDGTLNVVWEPGPGKELPGIEQPHHSLYSPLLLHRLSYHSLNRATGELWTANRWTRSQMEARREKLTFGWSKCMKAPIAVRRVVKALRHYGLAFVRGLPADVDAVTALAERLGPVRDTFYGRAWDVKAKPQAENVAYTSAPLDLHQDLLYMAEPPALQLLHCIRPSADGRGATRFSDAVAAYERLAADDPPAAAVFGSYAVPYQYRNQGHFYRFKRPHLEGGIATRRWPFESRKYPQEYDAVNWSPPFQAPLDVLAAEEPSGLSSGGRNLREYVQAAAKFKAQLARPDAVYETTLAAGECVIFDNRQLVHARTAFAAGPPGQERWLRGCYVDGDPLRSKWRGFVARALERSVAGAATESAFEEAFADPSCGL